LVECSVAQIAERYCWQEITPRADHKSIVATNAGSNRQPGNPIQRVKQTLANNAVSHLQQVDLMPSIVPLAVGSRFLAASYYALLRTCDCGKCRFGGMSSDGLADDVTKKRLQRSEVCSTEKPCNFMKSSLRFAMGVRCEMYQNP